MINNNWSRRFYGSNCDAINVFVLTSVVVYNCTHTCK